MKLFLGVEAAGVAFLEPNFRKLVPKVHVAGEAIKVEGLVKGMRSYAEKSS